MTTDSKEKWWILILAALTSAFAIGVPAVSLAVLFPEIAADLHLDLVQMGLLWSIGSLPAILTSPLTGAVDDRFGPKRIMLVGIALVSISAAVRGLAGDFSSLLLIIVVVGGLVPLITTSMYKICGVWFPPRQLGLANGVLSMGMALGSLLGSLLSATVFSPLLGGWRNVFLCYGAAALLLLVPWAFVKAGPDQAGRVGTALPQVSMTRALTHIIRSRDLWLIGIALMGLGGCLQGVAGYLPLYLRGLGWEGPAADGALSLLNGMSMLFVLPIAFASDRLGSRKRIVLAAGLLIAAGTGTLSVAAGWVVWAAVILVGMARDGAAALLITMSIEAEGIGPLYAGSASGFVMFFFFAGNLISPPLGNMLAGVGPGWPFILWAGMAGLGLLSLMFARTARSAGSQRSAR